MYVRSLLPAVAALSLIAVPAFAATHKASTKPVAAKHLKHAKQIKRVKKTVTKTSEAAPKAQ
ncbi:hypothetical protein [Stakelama marina]|uniref:Acid-shock protein n=1 Tax=Stakelama marina TaxID=2826939 RepID=A0A8T4IJ48_9SPHN|nr:hypothetical protein [Stakelama marina]MBR0552196.1 hypothetical protein [Stakelama marina]